MEPNYLCAEKQPVWTFSYFANKLNLGIQQLKWNLWNRKDTTQVSDGTVCLKDSQCSLKKGDVPQPFPSTLLQSWTKMLYPLCTLANPKSALTNVNFGAVSDCCSLHDVYESLVVEESLLAVSALKTRPKRQLLTVTDLRCKPIAPSALLQVTVEPRLLSMPWTISCTAFLTDSSGVDNNNCPMTCETDGCSAVAVAGEQRDGPEKNLQPTSSGSSEAHASTKPRRRKRKSKRKRNRRRRRSNAKKHVDRSLEVLNNSLNSGASSQLDVCRPNQDVRNQVNVGIIVVSPDVKNVGDVPFDHSPKLNRPFCANAAIALIIGSVVESDSDNESDDGWDETDSCWNDFKNPYFECDLIDGAFMQLPQDHLIEINRKWKQEVADTQTLGPNNSTRNKKVRFAADKELFQVHHMHTWTYAYQAARSGPWEAYARDRERFQKRICDASQIISPILHPEHRAKAFRRMTELT